MKKIKNLAVVSAVLLSMLMCFDDSISLFSNIDAREIPTHSNCSDITHHHHFSLSDHYFQKSAFTDSNSEFASGFKLFPIKQSITDQFDSSIWQPPQINC